MLTQGNLSQHSFPEVLKSVGLNAVAGMLELSLSSGKRKIHLGEGVIHSAFSEAPGDHFGDFLARIGRVSPLHIDALMQSQSADRFLLRTLVEEGLIDAAQVPSFLEMHTAEWIYPMFDCVEGSFQFESGSLPVDELARIHLSVPNLLLEGIRRMKNAEIIHRGLRGDDSRVQMAPQMDSLLTKLALNSDDAFILSRVDSHISISEILQISPLGLEMTKRTLFGLLLTGVLQFSTPPDQPSSSSQKREARKESSRHENRNVPPRAAEDHKSAPAQSQQDTELDFIRCDVLRKYNDLKSQNYYEYLNIPSTASGEEIKKAYYSLAKKYHPDHYQKTELADIKQQLDFIFSELSNAYDNLKLPASRASYDAKLAETREEGNSSHPGSGQTHHAAVDAAGQQKIAELSFRQGRGYFENQDFWSAIQALRQSVRLMPEVPRYRYWLAMSLSKNPKWRREAEEHFQKAIDLEPFNAAHYLGMALMFQEVGMLLRAESLLKRAQQVAPGDKSVLEALQLLKSKMSNKGNKESKEKKSFKDIFRWKKDPPAN
jgi:curved DNA-binding protein CbpA